MFLVTKRLVTKRLVTKGSPPLRQTMAHPTLLLVTFAGCGALSVTQNTRHVLATPRCRVSRCQLCAEKKLVAITDSTFEESVIRQSNEQPVLVEFGTDCCGPCRLMCPTMRRSNAPSHPGHILTFDSAAPCAANGTFKISIRKVTSS